MNAHAQILDSSSRIHLARFRIDRIGQLASALFFIAAATAAHAQNTPVGVWKTIDDDTKQEKSLVRITESGGVVSGKIDKLLNPTEPNPVCDKCSDDRKGKPITGMSIIEGLKQSGEVWEGGEILDPNNGKVYRGHGPRSRLRTQSVTESPTAVEFHIASQSIVSTDVSLWENAMLRLFI